MDQSRDKERILVVDDEPEVHTMLGKILTREGYLVDHASNAEEAFLFVTTSRPDLILLDIMMPKTSGIEVCNQLKANPATSDILVMIVSARDAQADRIEGLEHGADDYVSKPFHLKSLARKIEHMLKKRRDTISTPPKG